MQTPVQLFKNWRAYQQQKADAIKQAALFAEDEKRKAFNFARFAQYRSDFTELLNDEKRSFRDPESIEDVDQFVCSHQFTKLEKEAREIAEENRIERRFMADQDFLIKYPFRPGMGMQIEFSRSDIDDGFKFPTIAGMILNNSALLRKFAPSEGGNAEKDSKDYGFVMCCLLNATGGRASVYFDDPDLSRPNYFTLDKFATIEAFKQRRLEFDVGRAYETRDYILEEVNNFQIKWPNDRITAKMIKFWSSWPL